jgi:hypothetical protein
MIDHQIARQVTADADNVKALIAVGAKLKGTYVLAAVVVLTTNKREQ